MPVRPSRKLLQALCSDPAPDDGIEPRETVRQTARKRGGRKTRQLCGQVARAVNYALSGLCNDDVLRGLCVVVVQPVPDESRLLVTVGPALPGAHDLVEIQAHLERARGKLRAEVAAAIHRKKVPELAFRSV